MISKDQTSLAEPRIGGGEKFKFIQAFRGIAALWVVLFHLEKNESIRHVTEILPDYLLESLFRYGSAGVAIFFVLSGFVIAHSLRNTQMSMREFGKFVVRRSVRLDPPYWVSIAIAVSISAVFAAYRQEEIVIPTIREIIAHVFYVQEILGMKEIQIVYWTLTYEIQFYLVLAFSLQVVALLSRGFGEAFAQGMTFAFLYVLALVSALAGNDWAPNGVFANLWHGFFLGVLSYEAGVRQRRTVALTLLVAATAVSASYTPGVFGAPCAVMAILLFVAARTRVMEGGLAWAPMQWLGAISYSLYLVHWPVLQLTSAVWQKLFGRGMVSDMGALIAQLTACIIAAYALRVAVEAPSQQLAKRLFAR